MPFCLSLVIYSWDFQLLSVLGSFSRCRVFVLLSRRSEGQGFCAALSFQYGAAFSCGRKGSSICMIAFEVPLVRSVAGISFSGYGRVTSANAGRAAVGFSFVKFKCQEFKCHVAKKRVA